MFRSLRVSECVRASHKMASVSGAFNNAVNALTGTTVRRRSQELTPLLSQAEQHSPPQQHKVCHFILYITCMVATM